MLMFTMFMIFDGVIGIHLELHVRKQTILSYQIRCSRLNNTIEISIRGCYN